MSKKEGYPLTDETTLGGSADSSIVGGGSTAGSGGVGGGSPPGGGSPTQAEDVSIHVKEETKSLLQAIASEIPDSVLKKFEAKSAAGDSTFSDEEKKAVFAALRTVVKGGKFGDWTWEKAGRAILSLHADKNKSLAFAPTGNRLPPYMFLARITRLLVLAILKEIQQQDTKNLELEAASCLTEMSKFLQGARDLAALKYISCQEDLADSSFLDDDEEWKMRDAACEGLAMLKQVASFEALLVAAGNALRNLASLEWCAPLMIMLNALDLRLDISQISDSNGSAMSRNVVNFSVSLLEKLGNGASLEDLQDDLEKVSGAIVNHQAFAVADDSSRSMLEGLKTIIHAAQDVGLNLNGILALWSVSVRDGQGLEDSIHQHFHSFFENARSQPDHLVVQLEVESGGSIGFPPKSTVDLQLAKGSNIVSYKIMWVGLKDHSCLLPDAASSDSCDGSWCHGNSTGATTSGAWLPPNENDIKGSPYYLACWNANMVVLSKCDGDATVSDMVARNDVEASLGGFAPATRTHPAQMKIVGAGRIVWPVYGSEATSHQACMTDALTASLRHKDIGILRSEDPNVDYNKLRRQVGTGYPIEDFIPKVNLCGSWAGLKIGMLSIKLENLFQKEEGVFIIVVKKDLHSGKTIFHAYNLLTVENGDGGSLRVLHDNTGSAVIFDPRTVGRKHRAVMDQVCAGPEVKKWELHRKPFYLVKSDTFPPDLKVVVPKASTAKAQLKKVKRRQKEQEKKARDQNDRGTE
jgi:hypothetical protein